MFTELTIKATTNATEASISMMGFSEEIRLNQGTANVTVKDILGALDSGEPGVSLQSMREFLGDSPNMDIKIYSDDDAEEVTVNIKLPPEH